MGFSRQEYCSGLLFPSPGNLPDPGIKLRSPALQTDSLLSETGKQPTDSLCISAEGGLLPGQAPWGGSQELGHRHVNFSGFASCAEGTQPPPPPHPLHPRCVRETLGFGAAALLPRLREEPLQAGQLHLQKQMGKNLSLLTNKTDVLASRSAL